MTLLGQVFFVNKCINNLCQISLTVSGQCCSGGDRGKTKLSFAFHFSASTGTHAYCPKPSHSVHK